MLSRLLKKINSRYSTKWICPNCGCELPYGGEGNMKCPYCGKWMLNE